MDPVLAHRPDEAARSVRIPTGRDPGWPARAVWAAPGSPFAEAFRHLALRVRTGLERAGASSVLVTSALPQEGKTVTACNLALALASLSPMERVALVDFDLRLPGVARALQLEARIGLADVLRGDAPLHAAALVTEAGLDVYPNAAPSTAAHELLVRGEVPDVLKRLQAQYRWVVCDAPPLLPVPDVELLIPHLGGCLAVVRAGSTRRSVLREFWDEIPREKTLGFFLNDMRPPAHARRYHRSGYYTDLDSDPVRAR